ncbi:HEAT repeat domain-containing protein [Planctopirus hydrillae]|uniref:HEAT repeat domain-containing protein n=1 Tax=Planctopirus hydrillae TaxID=1841610 RepID=A0A1C3EBV6_9PLAN|nr:HEAT repeat domain-containing protein [Planctopirus hydrillae]ODA30736.1 hypothetical protein A6X21_05490 [Planctopirus hydrillae]
MKSNPLSQHLSEARASAHALDQLACTTCEYQSESTVKESFPVAGGKVLFLDRWPTRFRTQPSLLLTLLFGMAVAGCQKAEDPALSANSSNTPTQVNMAASGSQASQDDFPVLTIAPVAEANSGSAVLTIPAAGPGQLLLPVPENPTMATGIRNGGLPESSPAAEAAFAELLQAARGGSTPDQWQVAEQKLTQLGTTALGIYVRHLKDDDLMVRELASMFLAQLGPEAESSAPEIVSSLQDHSLFVRANVASVLSSIVAYESKVAPVLLGLLESDEINIRMIAATSLGNLTSQSDLVAQIEPALLKLVDDPAVEVRQAAIRSLAQSGSGTPAIRKTLQAIARQPADPLQEEAAQALRRLDGAPKPGDATPASNSDE